MLTSTAVARRVSDRQRRDEAGASAVEYGLLIAGIAALIVVAVFAFGGGVKTLFNNTCTTVGSAAHAGTC